MKNSVISIFLFIVLCGFIFYSDSIFLDVLDKITDETIEIETLIKDNKLDEALSKSKELETFVKKENVIASIYVNHCDYDALVQEAIRLRTYLSEAELPDALSALRLLKYDSKGLRELQAPVIKNIF